MRPGGSPGRTIINAAIGLMTVRALVGQTILGTITIGADHSIAKRVKPRQESRVSNILGRHAGRSSRAFTSAIVLILLFLVGCFVWRIFGLIGVEGASRARTIV